MASRLQARITRARINRQLELHQSTQIDEALDLVDVIHQARRFQSNVLATHILEQQRSQDRRHAAVDLESHDHALPTRRRGSLHFVEQIVGGRLVERELGGARDAEDITLFDTDVRGIDRVEVAAHDILERDEDVLLSLRHIEEARYARR